MKQQKYKDRNALDTTPARYCLYARKSMESEERQALSIDSQIKEMLELAKREKLNIVEIMRESHSAKEVGQRPVFNEIINCIKENRFNAILTWAADRLSRNAGDLGSLVDLMDYGKLKEIRTYSQKFSDNPNEKFLLMILCSQAKLENDNKGINVRRGMKARVEMGLWPGPAPMGYLNQNRIDKRCELILDEERAPIIKEMFKKVFYENYSGRKIYKWLKFELHYKTRGGNNITLSSIYAILHNSFYYGTFEYPKGGGVWYKGKHEPIVSKTLFNKVQKKLAEARILSLHSREFAFTKLMTCGLCGSGITASEKIKRQKNGNIHKYVYYYCTAGRDRNCKAISIREDRLMDQLLKLIDDLDLEDLGIEEKIKKEVERYHRFRSYMLGITYVDEENQKRINIKDYAKYILQQGTILEKRELMSGLKSELFLKNKIITVKK